MINQSKEITEELKQGLGLSELTGYPRKVAESIVPTFETNTRKINRTEYTAILNSAAAGTLITCSANKKTFLWGYNLNFIKDAGSTSIYSYLDFQPKGLSIQRVRLSQLSGVAQTGNSDQMFSVPIELQPGSSVTCGATTADANITTRATIFLEEENITGD